MNVVGLIPARFGSTRLPGKPLRDICGKPMIQHVYERAMRASSLDRVIVATDDERIVAAVRGFGGEAFMTSATHRSGSDRIAEIVSRIDCGIAVNIQGDEPLILPEIIDEIVDALAGDPRYEMATGCFRIGPGTDERNPNVVKVVMDRFDNALYFSRSLIPYPRDPDVFEAFEHIGVYAFRKDFLLEYTRMPDTPLSRTESLEQLKVLENGYRIRVVRTRHPYNALSVDTQEDLDEVVRIMKESP